MTVGDISISALSSEVVTTDSLSCPTKDVDVLYKIARGATGVVCDVSCITSKNDLL